MKKLAFTMVLTIMILSVAFAKTSRAEDLALNLAEEFFKAGNYHEAITEYKRFICFNSNDEKSCKRVRGRFYTSPSPLSQWGQFPISSPLRGG